MRILFIHAWNKNETSYRGRFSNLLSYPSLTLPTLVSLVPEELDIEVDTCNEMSQKVRYDKKRYDIVAISFDTSSCMQAYEHALHFKARGAYILFGGYHTTFMPEEALEHADSIVVGPAEISLPLFLNDYVKGTPKRIYDYPNYDACHMKIPARDKVCSSKSLKIATVIANRGCNNRCKFCAISKMWLSNLRPIDEVIEEIKGLHSKKVIFFDPNFFKHRDYAMELMKQLERLQIKWATNATADIAFDDELLGAAQKAGCSGVLIGMESLSEQSLKGVRKHFSNAEKYKEVVERMHHYNIMVNGCFVLGFDHDTEEELLSIPEKVRYMHLDLTRFAILTPVPGTELYKEFEAQGRIITKDWSRYNQHYAVFEPIHMTPQRLEEIYRRVWKETYTFHNIAGRILGSPGRSFAEKCILLGANIGFKYLSI
jgi:radical SAM superfamily enzyme YgiQ (UPF0313 family)